jgi:hypothetical protein
MKHVKPRENFLDEEFNWKNPVESVKELIMKLKSVIPQKTIDEFIEENREKVTQVARMLKNDDGDIDYNKTVSFIKENLKK